MSDFAKRVRDWIAEGDSIKVGLGPAGRQVLLRLCGRHGSPLSLRETARRTGLSPTYLCQCMSGVQTISPQSYVDLCRFENQLETAQ